MATKKTAPAKKVSQTGFKTISWLKFLPDISIKRHIFIGLIIVVVTYGSFTVYRYANSSFCSDWNFLTRPEISLKSMSFDRPDGWQMHDCYHDQESNSDSFTLHDYQIPELALLVYVLGLSDGWGVFVPQNSGRIEVLTGDWIQNQSLDDIEEMYRVRWANSPIDVQVSKLKIAGHNALQIILEDGPRENLKGEIEGRYSYSKEIVIDVNGHGYALKLWNNWHKAESRDAWVAKYEPIFDRLIKSAKFH